MSDMTRAMAQVVDMAIVGGRICYLYKRRSKYSFQASYHYWNDWLFKAYPGGRKQLSIRGKELLSPDELRELEECEE
jgi:hypothetical protein